jgi:hypothetical protein
VKRFAIALVTLAALILSPAAASRPKLTKSDARLAAEVKASQYFSGPGYGNWSYEQNIGQCRRQSRYRVYCTGTTSGDEFTGTCSDTTFKCTYIHHDCSFGVPVHQAGYSAIARIVAVSCSQYSYQQ